VFEPETRKPGIFPALSPAALKIFVDMRTQCDLLQDFSSTPVRPLLSAPAVTLSTFTFLIADERR